MTIKKFVTYVRSRCAPRLSEDTSRLLSSEYVNIRKDMKERREEVGEDAQAVPITVRQLEALVRISESLAKMQLKAEVEPQHVEEAIRLFKVSTMSAASYNTSNMMEFANEETQKQVERADAFLKYRLQLNNKVNKNRVIEDAVAQRYSAPVIRKALSIMVNKNELREFNKGQMIERIR
jgi:DNA replication licensing factor MCM5